MAQKVALHYLTLHYLSSFTHLESYTVSASKEGTLTSAKTHCSPRTCFGPGIGKSSFSLYQTSYYHALALPRLPWIINEIDFIIPTPIITCISSYYLYYLRVKVLNGVDFTVAIIIRFDRIASRSHSFIKRFSRQERGGATELVGREVACVAVVRPGLVASCSEKLVLTFVT